MNQAEALRYLGYAEQPLGSDLTARIHAVFERGERYARPSWCFQVFPVSNDGGVASLRGSTIKIATTDSSLAPMERMSFCAIMACTIGLAFDSEARRLSVSETTDALIFDAAGSSLVEACADDCEAAINAYACEANLFAGQRMSPGYGDIPLGFSRDIIKVLDVGKRLGIAATDVDLLVPMKSVTAMVGLFETEEDARRAHRSCADCIARVDCAYLKAGKPCSAGLPENAGGGAYAADK